MSDVLTRMRLLCQPPASVSTPATSRDTSSLLERMRQLCEKRAADAIHDDDDDDDVSASDSLVTIRRDAAVQAARKHARAAPAAGNDATDQVSRLVLAHQQATRAAEQARDDDASETTIDRRAHQARLAAMPAVALPAATTLYSPPAAAPSAVALVPKTAPPLPAEPVTAVFAGSTGALPPLSMQENYALLERQVAATAATVTATPTPAGRQVAIVATQLVRNTPKMLTNSSFPRAMASMTNPLESSFLASLVTSAIDEAMVPPHLNDPQNPDVTRMRHSLRVSHRRHEELMLRPPRSNEPACSMGAECRGNAIICQGGGATLMAFYYEDEWAKYMYDIDHNVPNARLPDNSRLCLLCLRYDANAALMSVRAMNAQFRVANLATGSDGAPVLAQAHYNLTNMPGEYCAEDCNVPLPHVYEGFLCPMVKPNLMQFIRAIDTVTGDVVFRQLFPYPTDTPSGAAPPPPSMPRTDSHF